MNAHTHISPRAFLKSAGRIDHFAAVPEKNVARNHAHVTAAESTGQMPQQGPLEAQRGSGGPFREVRGSKTPASADKPRRLHLRVTGRPPTRGYPANPRRPGMPLRSATHGPSIRGPWHMRVARTLRAASRGGAHGGALPPTVKRGPIFSRRFMHPGYRSCLFATLASSLPRH